MSTLAQAQSEPRPGASGVDQYAELVPGAAGKRAPRVGSEEETPLPRDGKDALQQAPPEIAKPLEGIATSSDYGAPRSRAEATGTEPRAGRHVSRRIAMDATLQSTVSAIGSVTDAHVTGLLVAVLLTTAAAIALAANRRRVF